MNSPLVRHLIEEYGAEEGRWCEAHPGRLLNVHGSKTNRWGHRAVRVSDNAIVICVNGEVIDLGRKTND